jgi:hypothetical protein
MTLYAADLMADARARKKIMLENARGEFICKSALPVPAGRM